MRKHPWWAPILVAALTVTGCGESDNRSTSLRVPVDAVKPNLLFILVDTLCADRLGCYGHARNLTPTMDAIAAEGVSFDLAVAQAPWT